MKRKTAMRFEKLTCLGFLLASLAVSSATAQTRDAEPMSFRSIYQEMVEIDTSPSSGSCTRLVEAGLKRLQEAGYSARDARLIVPTGAPDDGNLVARIEGSDPSAKAVANRSRTGRRATINPRAPRSAASRSSAGPAAALSAMA